MSHGVGRATPPSSGVEQSIGSVTAPMAGLHGSNAMVRIARPLFWRPVGSRPAGTSERLVLCVKPHEESSERLNPPSTTTPEHSPPEALLAMIVDAIVVVPPLVKIAPPPRRALLTPGTALLSS